MALDKKTATVVLASTAIGFVGDVLIYSLGESKGGKFKLAMPKGAELYKLLALGFFSGLVIDAAVKSVEKATMNDAERRLAELVEAERQRIANGQRDKMVPTSIVWAPQIA